MNGARYAMLASIGPGLSGLLHSTRLLLVCSPWLVTLSLACRRPPSLRSARSALRPPGAKPDPAGE
eukprot:1424728-Alexandrium_andersonii.AAC.1